MVSMTPKILERKPNKRTGLIYKSIYFWTLRFPCLNEYYDIFYKDNKKIIPNNLDELLTPVGLAYWIMEVNLPMGKRYYILDLFQKKK